MARKGWEGQTGRLKSQSSNNKKTYFFLVFWALRIWYIYTDLECLKTALHFNMVRNSSLNHIFLPCQGHEKVPCHSETHGLFASWCPIIYHKIYNQAGAKDTHNLILSMFKLLSIDAGDELIHEEKFCNSASFQRPLQIKQVQSFWLLTREMKDAETTGHTFTHGGHSFNLVVFKVVRFSILLC